MLYRSVQLGRWGVEVMDLREFTTSPNPSHWRQDASGKLVMPVLQSEFLDWLLTPVGEREQNTMKSWGEAHGVSAGTLGDWKKDRRFIREWEARADARNVGVERIQRIMDTLYEAGVDGDVQAAKMWLTQVEKMRPPKVVDQDAELEGLSDEELDELLADSDV